MGSLLRALRAFAALLTLNGLARGAAFISSMMIAKEFGAGEGMDAFFLSLSIAGVFSGLLASGITQAFLSELTRVSQTRKEFSQVLARGTGFSAVSAGGIVLLLPLAELVLDGSGGLELRLLWLLGPTVLFAPLLSLYGTALTIKGRAKLPSITPILSPCVTVAAILLVPQSGVEGLCLATTTACALETLVLAGALRQSGIRFAPSADLGNVKPDIRRLLAASVALAASSATALLDQYTAASLGPGAVSALGYGTKVGMALSVIGTQALLGLATPKFAAAAPHPADMRRCLAKFVALALALGALLLVTLAPLSLETMRILFERGRFSSEASASAASVHTAILATLPVAFACNVTARAVATLGLLRLLSLAALAALACKLMLNSWMASLLGPAGIWWASLPAQAVSILVMGSVLIGRLRSR